MVQERRDPWAKVPRAVISDRRLLDPDVRVYAALVLAVHGRESYAVSQARLAKMVGKSSRRVRDALDRLEAAGYIISGGEPGHQLTYTLCDPK